MKSNILNILDEYLKIFPEENEKQKQLVEYLKDSKDDEIVDWNNFNGHIVASGFIYARNENKFLVLYHKDFKKYVYPGGHAESKDKTPLETAKREIEEETGLTDLEELNFSDNEVVPIDINTHLVAYNERLNLPQHYHYDFRYLFVIEKIFKITIDEEESADYKWITVDELIEKYKNQIVISKVIELIKK